MRIALIGGGGSRTPLLYHGLLQRLEDLPPSSLVLHDTSAPWLARMRTVLRGLDEEHGDGLPTEATTDLDEALEGADFVLTAIRVGGFEARAWDEAVPMDHGVVGQETVGPGGFALALRNIPALEDVAATMCRRCPDAWLVNLTNPAGMATEALSHQLGDRVVGVCDSPTALMRRVADVLALDFGELHFAYGGLNHLGWLTGVAHEGRDVLRGLLDSDRLAEVEEARLVGLERVRALGAVPNEYLYYYERPDEVVNRLATTISRGRFLAERRSELAVDLDRADTPAAALQAYRASLARRQDTYMTVESGLEREPTTDVFADAGGYHEMALSVIAAIAGDVPTVAVVNTRNRGALDFLDPDAVVEVPTVVRRAGVFPLASQVPASQRALVEQVKHFETRTIAAVRSGSRREAADALAAHPLVPSRPVAEAIVADYTDRVPATSAQLVSP